ncbi:hypothetical protein PMAYCL1PPCAC_17298, partial [Pristionchus mayeri]
FSWRRFPHFVSTMPKQEFDLIDYAAPVVVGVIFAICLFVASLVINFTCIQKEDDITQFEKFAARRNFRMGPHNLKMVKNCMANDKRFIADCEL